MKIDVYCDGSGTTGNRAAGFGWLLLVDGKILREGNGHMDKGSNNDAEMQAAIAGLAAAFHFYKACVASGEKNIIVTLCSDSQITLGWADGSYRFKQEHKYDKFLVLKELVKRMHVKTRWVKGHSGDVYNTRCDVLANLGRHKLACNEKLPSKHKRGARSTNRYMAGWKAHAEHAQVLIAALEQIRNGLTPDINRVEALTKDLAHKTLLEFDARVREAKEVK
jgi:ribonuclease HI